MLKKLLLRFLITAMAVAVMIFVVPGIILSGSLIEFTMIAAVFYAINFLVKPLTKIVFLPIEIATLGLVSIAINATTIFLLPRYLDSFRVSSFWFSGLSGSSFLVAPIEIPMLFTAIAGAIILGIISTLLYWLIK